MSTTAAQALIIVNG